MKSIPMSYAGPFASTGIDDDYILVREARPHRRMHQIDDQDVDIRDAQ